MKTQEQIQHEIDGMDSLIAELGKNRDEDEFAMITIVPQLHLGPTMYNSVHEEYSKRLESLRERKRILEWVLK